jgi:signal transduction histidine kinase
VHQDADKLELSIRDDGIGFEPDLIREGNGYESGYEGGYEGGSLGLFGMQIRAKRVGGSVEVKSTFGRGTELLAVFPLDMAFIEPG